MDLKDLFLTPLYLLILYGIASKLRKNHFKGHPFEPYFMNALTLKFVGAIGAGMVYWFYYGYGDTRGYFIRGTQIYDFILNDFSTLFDFFFESRSNDQPYEVLAFLHRYRAFADTASYFMFKTTAFLSFFTFNTYSCIAVLFAFFSFLSSLYLYKTLLLKYPELHKEIALAIFFIPSVFFWGSGLFKDSLSFAGLCLTTAGLLNFVNGVSRSKSMIRALIGMYLMLHIKAYILMSFLPCFAFYMFLQYNEKIKSETFRKIVFPLFLLSGLGAGFFALQQVSSVTPEWSLEVMERRANDMQQWHSILGKVYSGDGAGSNYSIGDLGDFTLGGMALKLPLVLSITFYRPFLWEVRTPFMLLNSIEGIYFIYVTLLLFKKHGLGKIFEIVSREPIVIFCLSFAIIFGFGVGFTSMNYGALARYKIPCLPFYLLFVFFSDYLLSTKYYPKAKKAGVI